MTSMMMMTQIVTANNLLMECNSNRQFFFSALADRQSR